MRLRFALTPLALAWAAGCARKDSPAPAAGAEAARTPAADTSLGGRLFSGLAAAAARQDSLDRSNPNAGREDPCVLLARSDVEALLGPLRHDPYRAGSDGTPSPSGSECVYQAQDGRNVKVDVSFTGGKMQMGMIGAVSGLLDQTLQTNGASADTLDGGWDEARWQFPGSLYVLKGDTFVEINVAGSRAGAGGAARLAKAAVARLGDPLKYDGARAAADAPGPLVAPRDPCTLLTRAEAEAVIGPLAAAPTAQGQSACVYQPVKHPVIGTGEIRLQVLWRDGFKAFADGKAAYGMFQKNMVDPVNSSMGKCSDQGGEVKCRRTAVNTDEMAKDTDMQKFMNKTKGLLKALGGAPEFEKGSMNLKTDTLVAGPWAEGAVLGGSALTAVKKDVMISVGLGVLSLEQAQRLMVVAMNRI
jgi:hypothetical protein